MIEVASTSETLVNFYQTIRCNNPEDSDLHLDVCAAFIFYTYTCTIDTNYKKLKIYVALTAFTHFVKIGDDLVK
jgi:hypothetical protein